MPMRKDPDRVDTVIRMSAELHEAIKPGRARTPTHGRAHPRRHPHLRHGGPMTERFTVDEYLALFEDMDTSSS